MVGSWHVQCPPEDRRKIIHVLVTTLKALQPNTYNDQRARAEAETFEKMAFQKAQSRDEYMAYIRKKVNQLRQGSNDANQMAPQGNANNTAGNQNRASVGQNNFFPRDRQQQQQQQPMQQMRAQQPNSAGQPMLTQQQQQQAQIANMIRTGPIPQQLLAKMPMLPPNVITWPQVMECMNKKMIPQSAAPLIKEMQAAHIQLVLRQQQQQQQQQKMNQLRKMNAESQGTNGGQGNMLAGYGNSANTNASNAMAGMNMNMSNNVSGMGMNMGGMGGMSGGNNGGNMGGMNNVANAGMNMNMNNMGGMNNMGNMSNMNMNRQMGNSGGNNMSNQSQQSQMMQQQNYMNNKTQAKQQMPGQNMGMGMNQQQQQQQAQNPNQLAAKLISQLTKEEIEKYSREAMAYLMRLQQNGSMLQNLDQNQKQMFIRKYILQYKLSKTPAINPGITPKLQPNKPQQNMNMMGNFGALQPQLQQQMGQQQIGQQMGQQQQMGQMNQNSVNMHVAPQTTMGNVSQPSNDMMSQSMRAAKINAMQQSKPVQVPFNGAPNGARPPNGALGGLGALLSSLIPPLTDEMKLQLQSLGAEIAQKQQPLKDITLLLSEADKARVKELMAQLAQQALNVDNILTYFYVLTTGNSRVDGAKRLLQLKMMTKNIYDNLRQGIYLANPDLVEKMRLQYLKFTDYVKERILAQKAQQDGLNHQQQQQQQQQMQPQNPLSAQLLRQGQQPQNQQQMPQGMRNNMGQYVQNNAQYSQQGMQLMMPGGFAGGAQPVSAPPAQQLPQNAYTQKSMTQPVTAIPLQQLQYARNMPNLGTPPQKMMPNSATSAARMGSSPIPVPGAGSPPAGKQANKTAPVKKPAAAAGRRKNAKPTSAIPTPASAPTPATLANAIKTPNNIPTPLLPQTHSNKGTPNESSPSNDMKTVILDKEPIMGDVFRKNSSDSRVAKRRELSNTDPEKFFFSALSNLLELGDDVDAIKTSGGDDGAGTLKSPLSPKAHSDWSADIKPFALVSAFRQVDAIRDLTSSDILAECAELVKLEAPPSDATKVKRELEDDEDLELLFVDKKHKVNFGFEDGNTLVEFDDWKSWLTKLQET